MSANRRRTDLPLTRRYPTERGRPGRRDPFLPQNPLRQIPIQIIRRVGGPGPAILILLFISFIAYVLSRETSIFQSNVSITPVPLKYEPPRNQPEQPYRLNNNRPTAPTAINTHPDPHPPPTSSSETRYLAYLPHSGFHSQRIALENAAILAQLLNRTLLVPPVWLGRVPPWQTLHKLKNLLVKSDKRGLEYCRNIQKKASIPKECLSYFDGTRVGWDWLVNLHAVTGGEWVDRWDFSDDYLFDPLDHGGLELDQEDVYYLEENSRYQFRIYDDPEDDADTRMFKVRMDLRTLEHLSTYRLLHLGSTYSTSRLRLNLPASKDVRENVLKAMQITNPIIVNLADKIANLLGPRGEYVALHARVNEKVFRWEAGRNMRDAWWAMGRALDVDDEALAVTEKKVWDRSLGWRSEVLRRPDDSGQAVDIELPPKSDIRPAQISDDYPPIPSPIRDPFTEKHSALQDSLYPLDQSRKGPARLVCPRLLHTSLSLQPLNQVLFLATDSPDPIYHPALRLFHSTYPCTFTLSSHGIKEIVEETLGGLVNDMDGVPLKPFLMAFVDAEVAARARSVVGTKGSTFSRFVVDVATNVVKGWPIIIRA